MCPRSSEAFFPRHRLEKPRTWYAAAMIAKILLFVLIGFQGKIDGCELSRRGEEDDIFINDDRSPRHQAAISMPSRNMLI